MTQELTGFAKLKLSAPLLQAIHDLNFTIPSRIQDEAIPLLLEGRDLIGQAQTGTGKTAAFALPILHCLNLKISRPQALILAPTRELAIQVAEHFQSLCAYLPGVKVLVLCGGQDYRPQLKSLRDGAQIVVGTPGRILDHMERGTLDLSSLTHFVLDEADEMLRMGFIEDVETILAKIPVARQMALFSATMPGRIRQIAERYLKDPVSVEIRMETATVKSIEQRFLFASQAQKPDALLRILAFESCQGVIVFCRTKSSTDEIAELLQKHGHRAMAINGDMTQVLRERVIAQFRQGAIDVLVATDVAARGLDVDRVTHVINYDMAHDCETYVHRIGRTGRAGRSGVTILFVTPRESRMLSSIERHTRQRIEKTQVPNNHMIQGAKEKQFIEKISERLQHANLPAYQKIIETYLQENKEASPVDVAAALALLFHQDKAWKHETFDDVKEVAPKEARIRREGGPAARTGRLTAAPSRDTKPLRDDYPQELFRIDVGRVHGVKPGNIVGAIANEAGLQSRFIQGIKIHDDHTTVRLPKGMAKEVFHGLNKAWVCGRQLKLTSLGAL
jgi:ATP-dependent RNA helicase DeaD